MLTKLRSFLLLGSILVLLLAVAPTLAQTATPSPAREVEITGTVTALTSTTITINGLTIQITGAEFNDLISVGDVAKVHYTVGANGVRVAREAELAFNGIGAGFDDEFEIVGTVSALTSTTITIDNQVIQITGAEINDPVTVGAFVKIHFSLSANGALVAREVELALDANLDGIEDNSHDGAGHDLNDDHGNDGAGHDLNDDHGNDGAGHDVGDDHGNDGAGHDVGDDHGGSSGQGGNDDHGGDNSGHGGGNDDHGGNSGHGGGDD